VHVGFDIGDFRTDARDIRPNLVNVGSDIAEFRAHLAQKLKDQAGGLFGHRVILTPSPTGVSIA
jgi:hypothetical protein